MGRLNSLTATYGWVISFEILILLGKNILSLPKKLGLLVSLVLSPRTLWEYLVLLSGSAPTHNISENIPLPSSLPIYSWKCYNTPCCKVLPQSSLESSVAPISLCHSSASYEWLLPILLCYLQLQIFITRIKFKIPNITCKICPWDLILHIQYTWMENSLSNTSAISYAFLCAFPLWICSDSLMSSIHCCRFLVFNANISCFLGYQKMMTSWSIPTVLQPLKFVVAH